MRPTCLALAFSSLLLAGHALAQTPPARIGPELAAPGSGPPSATTPWAQGNDQAMQTMQQAMMNASGGATSEDEAFVRGMLPHHQGAIDMSRVELQYGHDPELKRLATRIIAAQQMEIREMSAWLARHR